MSEKKTFRSGRSPWADANTSFSGCDMVISVDVIFPDGKKKSKVIGSMQTLTYSIHMDKFPVRSVGNVNAKDYVFGPRTIAGTLIFAVFDRHFAYELLSTVSSYDSDSSYHPLMDEMPPMNITITFANEHGKNARLALYGVRIVNEGQTMSINDIYTENTYQFVATDIEYLNNDTSAPLGLSGQKRPAEMIAFRKTAAPNPVVAKPDAPEAEKEYEAKPSPPKGGGMGGIRFEIQ